MIQYLSKQSNIAFLKLTHSHRYALSGVLLLLILVATSLSTKAQVTAVYDDYLGQQNAPLNESVALNDIIPAGQTAIYSIVQGPTKGSFDLNPDGTFTYFYIAPPNEYGFYDSIYYEVCAGGMCDTTLATVYVIFRNNSPFAGDDYVTVVQNTPRTFDVSGNDGDPDSLTDPFGTSLEWIKLSNPSNGIITYQNDLGIYTYVPNTGFIGNDSFRYYVVDRCGWYEIATVYCTVIGPNMGPTAQSQTISLSEDQIYNGSLAPLVNDPENDALSFQLITSGLAGQLTLGTLGAFTFSPNTSFSGTTSFQYSVCDITGQCDTATITLTVNNIDNDPPVLVNDSRIINEDSSGTINVSVNDTDDTGVLTYSLFSGPSNGTALALGNSGEFSYTPNSNYFGFDSFIVQACDGVHCSTSTVNIQINSVNDSPTASPISISTAEDTSINGFITTIIDSESSPLTFSVLPGTTIQGFILNSNGSYIYNPPANYFGTQSVQVQGCDPQSLCATAILTIVVAPVNDLPIASNDSFSTSEDQALTGNIATGDSDVEGSSLNYASTGNAIGGTLYLSSTGAFTYIPNLNWFGMETIVVSVCDNQGGCSNSTLTITVNAVNDQPVSSNANLSTSEDNLLNGNLSAYASDIESATLNFSLLTQPNNGVFNLSSGGNFTYTPAPNFFGVDQVTFNACDAQGACTAAVVAITVQSINDAPTVEDFIVTMSEDVMHAGTIQIADPDHSSFTLTIAEQVEHGVFQISNSGSYNYMPQTNFFGNDELTLTICDALNACTSLNIMLEVQPVADAPIASNDFFIVEQNSTLTANMSNNDLDGDADITTYQLLNELQHGLLTLQADGSISFFPEENYLGSQTIAYRVCDATGLCDTAELTIEVVTYNTAPIASAGFFTLQEDEDFAVSILDLVSDIEGGTLSFSTFVAPLHGSVSWGNNGQLNYHPETNFFGSDVFTYRVCDSGNQCAEAVMEFTIDAVNDAPIVSQDVLTGTEDNALTANLSSNDTEVESEELIYTILSPALNGSVSLNTDGFLFYEPVSDFSGSDAFTYLVCDQGGNCTQGIAELTIAPVNDAPVAHSIDLSGIEDVVFDDNLTGAVFDAEGDVLTFGAINNNGSGTLIIDANGSFNLTAEENFFGTTTVAYWVCDNGGLCDTAFLDLEITPVNDAPFTTHITLSTQEDTNLSADLSIGDFDIEGDGLIYTLENGSLLSSSIELTSEGILNYSPIANIFGSEELMVSVCDELGACASKTVAIEILPVNDAPIASEIILDLLEDQSFSFDLGGSIADIENEVITFQTVTTATLGNIDLNESGIFQWTPYENIFGNDTLYTEVCDATGACAPIAIILKISAVNDAPTAQTGEVTLSEDSTTGGNLNEFTTDVDNDLLQFEVLSNVNNGIVSLNPDGSFIYAPTINFSGHDTLHYRACDVLGMCVENMAIFEVTFLNDLPIVYGESVQVIMNTTVSGSVAENDEELDAEVLLYTIIEDLSGGDFVMNSDGTYAYTPAPGAEGLFSVTYSACDPCNACDDGTITFYVVSEDQANTPPTALDYTGEVCQGATIIINLFSLISDEQDDAYALNLTFGTANSGSYQLDPETQELIYQASTFASDLITIPYYVSDNGVISMWDSAFIFLNVATAAPLTLDGVSIEDVNCYAMANGSIDLNVSGASNLVYEWSNGDQTSSVSNLSGGTYSVTVNSLQSCVVPFNAEFTVNEPLPVQHNAEILDSDNNGITFGDEILLIVSGGTPPYSITWQTPSGNAVETSAITIAENGAYNYHVADANGCSAIGSVSITHTSELIAASTISVYPNPVGSEHILNVSGLREGRLQIFNSHGQLILDMTGSRDVESIDVQSWASGIYHFRVSTASGVHSGKIVKQ